MLAAQVPSLVREVGLHGALMRLAPIADDLGIGDELRDAAAAGAGPAMPLWRSTIEHILAGDLEAAADMMASAGIPNVESNLRKHAGLRMLAVGRTAEAKAELDRASCSTARSTPAPTSRRSRRSRWGSERLGVGEREAVGHAGDVVDDLVDVVAALDEAGEDRA